MIRAKVIEVFSDVDSVYKVVYLVLLHVGGYLILGGRLLTPTLVDTIK
ncbi:hypothetical protein [Thermodesulfobacterium thermophilum]|nr:hypothetical protein [Thermodesulfobacterium thermophilum]